MREHIKILFLVPYPTAGASNRIRVEQFIPYLTSKGIGCRVRPFVNPAFYKIMYIPGRYVEKILWFIICTINRGLDILRSLKYDIIFIHREAYPFGGPFFETIFSKMGKTIIFDFDDAIFLPNTSEQNVYIERFKSPGKTAGIIRMSSLVIAGNEYLKEYAAKYNGNVVMIPSSVDTDKYRPLPDKSSNKQVMIGWIGSNTTKRFLYDIEDVFVKLSAKYENLAFKIVGAKFNSSKLKNVINKEWALDEEIDDLRTFDIGIMPMPDNEWTRGKCGFKAILYMACGIPVVASPVGVNTEIIRNGENGFLAKDQREWVNKLSFLIEDADLRGRLGARGREMVEKYFSVEKNFSKVVNVITGIHERKDNS